MLWHQTTSQDDRTSLCFGHVAAGYSPGHGGVPVTVPLPCRRIPVPKLTAYEKEMLRQGQFVSLNPFLMPGDMFVIESGGERFATVCISSEWRKSAIRRITPDEVVAVFCGE